MAADVEIRRTELTFAVWFAFQIQDAVMANGSIMLSVDNAKLAQDDFRVKSEPPPTSHQSCFPPPSCLLSFPFMHEVSGSTAASFLPKWEVFQLQCPLLVAAGTAAEGLTHPHLADDYEWNVSQMQRMNNESGGS